MEGDIFHWFQSFNPGSSPPFSGQPLNITGQPDIVKKVQTLFYLVLLGILSKPCHMHTFKGLNLVYLRQVCDLDYLES